MRFQVPCACLVLCILFIAIAGCSNQGFDTTGFETWAREKVDEDAYTCKLGDESVAVSRVPLTEKDGKFIFGVTDTVYPKNDGYWCYPGGIHCKTVKEAADVLREKANEALKRHADANSN
ncbi:MAG: hypothetical protein COA78_35345 [Blastopirellula sp.]|nr:MAG: hypothetical protein COA78_35345 [Blastopirellula sp.]